MKKTINLMFLLFTTSIIAQTDNEVLGTGAGSSISSGDSNVFIGDNAGMSVTSGSRNTFVGESAGLSQTTASDNTFVGHESGFSVTTALDNTFIGTRAGFSVATGSSNTFVGESAGLSQTTASDNTFIGHHAGFSVTTGTDNTFIGTRAGFSNTSTDGTFVGSDAGYYNTSGSDNTFIGEESGKFNTTGNDNVFIGENTGLHNTDGDANVAVGNNALEFNHVGRYNTAVGYFSGYDLGEDNEFVFASRNTLLGTASGADIGAGQGNTMLGANAGANTEGADFNTFVGAFAGWDNNRNNRTNANRNTGLGVFAGYNNREGEDNVWIGAFANTGTWGTSTGLENDMYDTCFKDCNLTNVGTGDTTIYRSTVLGANATVRENDGIAIGYLARTYGDSAIVIGSQADSYYTAADFSIAIGASVTTNDAESIVLGYQTVSHAPNTFTVGNANTVSWDPSSDSATSLGISENCYEDPANPTAIICDPMYRFTDVSSNKVSVNAASTNAAQIDLFADAGANNNDKWTISVANGGDFSISSFANGADDNKFAIANTGDVVIAGDLALNSDRRLKTGINSITNSLDSIMQLDGKSYFWKDKNRAPGQHLGFIAQEVEEILPQLVSQDKAGIKSVNYQGMMPVLVNAIKELNKKSMKQDQMILQLQNLIEQQQALIIKLAN